MPPSQDHICVHCQPRASQIQPWIRSMPGTGTEGDSIPRVHLLFLFPLHLNNEVLAKSGLPTILGSAHVKVLSKLDWYKLVLLVVRYPSHTSPTTFRTYSLVGCPQHAPHEDDIWSQSSPVVTGKLPNCQALKVRPKYWAPEGTI